MSENERVTGGSAGPVVGLDVDDPDCPVISINGDVDIDGAPSVRAAIDRALGTEPTRVVFDLAGVDFMDSSGLAVLLEASNRVGAISVRNPSSAVRMIIEATALDEILPTEP